MKQGHVADPAGGPNAKQEPVDNPAGGPNAQEELVDDPVGSPIVKEELAIQLYTGNTVSIQLGRPLLTMWRRDWMNVFHRLALHGTNQ